MTQKEVEAEVDTTTNDIATNRAMDPQEATKAQSIEYLEGVVDWCQTSLAALKDGS